MILKDCVRRGTLPNMIGDQPKAISQNFSKARQKGAGAPAPFFIFSILRQVRGLYSGAGLRVVSNAGIILYPSLPKIFIRVPGAQTVIRGFFHPDSVKMLGI